MVFFGNRLYTTRLCLRRVEEADIPLLLKWSNCPECYGAFLTPERFTQDQLQQQMISGALWNDHEKHFMIELKADGTAIGTIHFWSMPGMQNTVVMALKIAVIKERGKGYGTEAQKFLIKHLIEVEKIEKILMYTDVNNLAQQRCLNKLGFILKESLRYEDQQVMRTGHLFELDAVHYYTQPVYQYHHE